jgi:hypothetical protein
MKKLTLFLLGISASVFVAKSQQFQVKIVNFTVKNQLPASINDWQNTAGALVLLAQKNPGAAVREMRLVLQIRTSGAIICGGNPAQALPVSDFTTRNFSTGELTGALTGCHDLKEGSYTLCAQFFSADRVPGVPVSNEVCKEFTVQAVAATTYTGPQNLQPADKAHLKETDARAVILRWTPVVPPPPDKKVSYHVKVWQMMQGQNATAIRRNNAPVYAADVENQTQTVAQGIYNGPCKPPYLCDYVWTVQATDQNGKPYGDNEGTSEPTLFSVGSQYIIQIDSLKVKCSDKPGQYNFDYWITNPNGGTALFSLLTVTSSTPAGATIGTFTPPLSTTIPSGNQIHISGIINGAPNLSNICVGAQIKDQVNTFNQAQKDTCVAVTGCKCDPCKTMGVTVANDNISTVASQSDEVVISGVFNGLNSTLVKKVTAELIYFNDIQTGDSNCAKCAVNKEWGNFVPPATSSLTGFSSPLLNGSNFGREWTWNSTTDKACDTTGGGGGGCINCGSDAQKTKSSQTTSGNQSANIPTGKTISPAESIGTGTPNPNGFSLPIAVPGGSTLSCCGDKIQVCIRYTWWDFCCHACDVVKCYTIERKTH